MQADLGFLLSSITGMEDYQNGKPRPDCLVAAAAAFGVPVADALYVGDHPVDYQTTRNAGCAFLLYSPNGEPHEVLKGVRYMTTHLDIWRHL